MKLNKKQDKLLNGMARLFAKDIEAAKQYSDPKILKELRKEIPTSIYINSKGNRRRTMNILKKSSEWFSQDYMTWVGEPVICPRDEKEMKVEREIFDDWRYRALEHNTCECGYTLDFPRYADALELIKTKKGLCGEYMHLFTGFLNALEIEARPVVDVTDHAWTEAKIGRRWVHVDSSANRVNAPMIYEEEWNEGKGKELSYIFAFNIDGTVEDVTRNYTKKWPEVKARRIVDPIPEYLISHVNLKAKYTKE